MANSIKFSVLADFHYFKPAWPANIAQLESILQRAADNHVDFVMHCGDFCADYADSPECTKAWVDNKHGLPVYGVYGNHELEGMNHGRKDLDFEHPMSYVTPYLTNRAEEVVWGTPDGKPAEWGEISYFWFEKNGFRIICTDDFYSYNPETDEWVHNPTLYVPKGNRPHEALGADQRDWLETVLTDAAHKNIPCIIISHCPFIEWRGSAGDHAEVLEIFNRVNAIRKGTVVASICGHLHTDRAEVKDGVVYLAINSVINGCWQGALDEHYLPEHTFTYQDYDAEGHFLGEYEKPLNEFWQGRHGWFHKDPLSAIITISDDGTVEVVGQESEWLYGVAPTAESIGDTIGVRNGITSGTYKAER